MHGCREGPEGLRIHLARGDEMVAETKDGLEAMLKTAANCLDPVPGRALESGFYLLPLGSPGLEKPKQGEARPDHYHQQGRKKTRARRRRRHNCLEDVSSLLNGREKTRARASLPNVQS
jgi:hypothetical protein